MAGSGALFAWASIPKFARAATARDPRFVTIILRGALDGLSAVAPVGDPDYAGLHGELALRLDGDHPALPLDPFFALNPAMKSFHAMFKDGEAAVVHAAATNYRDRSHFDGQDVLESGQPAPNMTDSGWLNRAVGAMPAGERVARAGALGVGVSTPLVMRGPTATLGWAPENLPPVGDDLVHRVLDMYAHSDPALGGALAKGIQTDKMAAKDGMGKPKPGYDPVAAMRRSAEGAAKLLAADAGPRVAALAFDGWDTHIAEGGATGRLAQLLGGLDGALQAFKEKLGPAWADTTILAVTEFGRTVHINGTTGTDHGTGTVAFLAGGAVKGGRVIADWPGLKPNALYQNRDLAPTTDVRAVAKGLLAAQFGLSEATLAKTVFPETAGVKPMADLVRA
ncbi:MAG: DUF1501 domain-containing protein [Hyphomicrobiales bacterium]|nr:DUF1501 domain-containing protein [Hyphomicrobiales bacterium]MDE2016785.1 DUF1501 domain-containing protein [Hyphomicrobiales bacterium]